MIPFPKDLPGGRPARSARTSRGGFATSTVAILALTLAFAGAIVGAVHGLVWLLRQESGERQRVRVEV